MLKFTCVELDEAGEEIPNTGCGDVKWIQIHLYECLDKEGEGLFVSFKDDQTFFIDDNNIKYFPTHWNKDEILNLVREHFGNGSLVDIGTCPNCGNDIYIV